MNQSTADYADIFANELETWRTNGAQLIDVREPYEYARGHVPGAQNIPRAVITMKVFVKWNQIAPVRVVLEARVVTEHGASSARVPGENADQAL